MEHDPLLRMEKRGLWTSAVASLLVGTAGVGFSLAAHSQAIMLDGLFNLIYFVMSLFTMKVASLVMRGDDERFPAGYALFEPLINGIKGMLILGISAMAIAEAARALFKGGRSISAGPAIVYGILATVVCWSTALAVRRVASKTGSPLVRVDAEGWTINGAISSAVLLTFVAILLMRGTSLEFLVPYVDPLLVLLLGGVTLGIPVRMAWRALMELLNRAPSQEVTEGARRIVEEAVGALPTDQVTVRVIQPGRTRTVMAHVVLSEGEMGAGLRPFDEARERVKEALQKEHSPVILDMVFTAEPKWGAPLGKSPE